MVSAFAARQRLVLGQVKVAEKSNEIIAIPKPNLPPEFPETRGWPPISVKTVGM
jgi:hypothetical protein